MFVTVIRNISFEVYSLLLAGRELSPKDVCGISPYFCEQCVKRERTRQWFICAPS